MSLFKLTLDTVFNIAKQAQARLSQRFEVRKKEIYLCNTQESLITQSTDMIMTRTTGHVQRTKFQANCKQHIHNQSV